MLYAVVTEYILGFIYYAISNLFHYISKILVVFFVIFIHFDQFFTSVLVTILKKLVKETKRIDNSCMNWSITQDLSILLVSLTIKSYFSYLSFFHCISKILVGFFAIFIVFDQFFTSVLVATLNKPVKKTKRIDKSGVILQIMYHRTISFSLPTQLINDSFSMLFWSDSEHVVSRVHLGFCLSRNDRHDINFVPVGRRNRCLVQCITCTQGGAMSHKSK